MIQVKALVAVPAVLLALGAGPAWASTETDDDGSSDPTVLVESGPAVSEDEGATGEVIEEPIETYTDTVDGVLAKPTTYQCRTVRVPYVKHTLLGFVAYKWWMRRRWCWRYPKIISVSTSTYVTDNNSQNQYKGVVASWGEWFAWCCRVSRSGHRAFRQAEFQNCILHYGCISSDYPWIRVTVRGNGTYSHAVGD